MQPLKRLGIKLHPCRLIQRRLKDYQVPFISAYLDLVLNAFFFAIVSKGGTPRRGCGFSYCNVCYVNWKHKTPSNRLSDAGYLLQRSEELEQTLLKRTSWHKRRTDTRHCMLQDLQKKLQPDLLLSDARLEALLEQALQAQV